MKSSKIIFFRLFLPFFLASFIFLSHPALAQDNTELENKDILDYSDAELVEQAKAQEGEKDGKNSQKGRKRSIGFIDTSNVELNRDFSMDVFLDDFIFGGLSYMIGVDIDRFVTIGPRITLPLFGGYATADQFRSRYTTVLGGAIQIEFAFSLINFFFPDFTAVDVEVFIRGGSVLASTLWAQMLPEHNNNPALAKREIGVIHNPNPDRVNFSFYYKPTFTIGVNLLLFERVYLYIGGDFGNALAVYRLRAPVFFVAPAGGIAFKLGD